MYQHQKEGFAKDVQGERVTEEKTWKDHMEAVTGWTNGQTDELKEQSRQTP